MRVKWSHYLFLNVLLTFSKPGPRERSQDLLLNEVVISSKKEYSSESNIDDLELPLFDFSTLAMATNNFSDENKLGQGGFGSVYKVINSSFPWIEITKALKM